MHILNNLGLHLSQEFPLSWVAIKANKSLALLRAIYTSPTLENIKS
jgi:hypothetical protein